MNPESEQALAQTLQILAGEIMRLRGQQKALSSMVILLGEKAGISNASALELLNALGHAHRESELLKIGDRLPDAARILDIYKLLEGNDTPPKAS